MKNLFRHLAGYVCTMCIMLGAPHIMAQDQGGYYKISGIVKDKDTHKKLDYVTVSVSGTNIGTVTNADGRFSLKIPTSLKAEKMEISHIGYFTYSQPLQKGMEEKTYYMIPRVILLGEVSVGALEAQNIVAAAVDRIGKNYSGRPNLLTCFYRETARKRSTYISISEAITNTYKTPYTENSDRDRVQVYKGRKLLSQKASDTLAVKLLGGPNLSVYGDVVKNPDLLLDKETLSFFTYKMEQAVMIGNRLQYVISFLPQVKLPYPLYYGTFYIDQETLAFTRAEFFLDMSDRAKATRMILKKKPLGLRFKPSTLSFLVTYKQKNGKSYLNYIRNEVKFKCDWKRRLFSTNYSIVSEMVVTENQEQNVTAIPGKDVFKKSQALSDKVMDFFDKDFWGAYNIIEPTESLESAVLKLKKQYK